MASNTYVVKKGDTLSGIAQKYKDAYGFSNTYTYVDELVKINDITDPNYIVVGQIIKLSGAASSFTNTTSKANIKAFGLQSNTDRTVYATWAWNKTNTDNYKVIWYYATGNGVWFVGNDSTTTYKQSTYNAPTNATKVKFKVKPVSKKRKVNGKDTTYWTASWSTDKTYAFKNNPPSKPSVPTVTITNLDLKATLTNIGSTTSIIQFEVVKNDKNVIKKEKVAVKTASASYACTVVAGGRYKVRCRAYGNGEYSDWSDYSNNLETIPAVPATFTTCRVENETVDKVDIYLEWTAVDNTKSYDIEYTKDKTYFDSSNATTIQNTSTAVTKYTITGLEKGVEYFFRLRAVNDVGSSGWSDIKSTVTGTSPAPPTTWSLTTTAVKGEPIYLYWQHNAEDNSSQTSAQIKIQINNNSVMFTMTNSNSKNETEFVDNLNGIHGWYNVTNTSGYCWLETADYTDGAKIRWCVRTAGVDKSAYSNWSIERVVDVYSQPSVQLEVLSSSNQQLGVDTYYEVSYDSALDIYTVTSTVLNSPNGTKINNAFTTTGEEVYSATINGVLTYYCAVDTKLDKYPFYISALAGPNTQRPTGYHLSIISNETYNTIDNIGNDKIVSAGDEVYSNHFDVSTKLEVMIGPSDVNLENNISYKVVCIVSMDSGLTGEASWDFTVGLSNTVAYTPDAEIGINDDNYSAWIRPYCADSTGNIIQGISLAVYRREFDGSFTEIAKNILNDGVTFVTDPHPALDYARYRIVSTVMETGAIDYYDVPGYPTNGKAVIIQWDEDWSYFDASSGPNVLSQPPWSGSQLCLPYNIDVSDSNESDVSLIPYIGRKRPVSYYGTQLGEKSTWNMEIDKNDKETLYGLRRLAVWMGDVYVREPSGSGYWANIKVSFSQKHCEMTIPVTMEITRVEGGV